MITNSILLQKRSNIYFSSDKDTKAETPKTNDSAIQHLSDSIKIKTIAQDDPSRIDKGEFNNFVRFLETIYPQMHNTLSKEQVSDYSLLYKWEGQNKSLKPVLIVGHSDVVPVSPGTEEDWTHGPFSGDVDENYVWGRGALDEKSLVIANCEAIESLSQSGFRPERTIYFAIGHDEETGGKNGAAKIAEILKQRGIEFECAIDEGMPIINDKAQPKGNRVLPGSVEKEVALIGIAQKGLLNLTISSRREPGHSSKPSPDSAINDVAEALTKIKDNPFPIRTTEPVKKMGKKLSDLMKPPYSAIFANMGMAGPLMPMAAKKSSGLNAQLRTTTAPTIFNSGNKANVIPGNAEANLNVRILPGDSIDEVKKYLNKVVNNPAVKIEPAEGINREPSGISPTDSPGYRSIVSSYKEVYPEAKPVPSLMIGTSDSYHYQSRGLIQNGTYWVYPWKATKEDLQRIHGTNERISKDDFLKMIDFYKNFITNASAN